MTKKKGKSTTIILPRLCGNCVFANKGIAQGDGAWYCSKAQKWVVGLAMPCNQHEFDEAIRDASLNRIAVRLEEAIDHFARKSAENCEVLNHMPAEVDDVHQKLKKRLTGQIRVLFQKAKPKPKRKQPKKKERFNNLLVD